MGTLRTHRGSGKSCPNAHHNVNRQPVCKPPAATEKKKEEWTEEPPKVRDPGALTAEPNT